MKELRQDTWMSLLNRIPVMLLGFISITILTRWLGPEGNGIYTFIFANINLLLLLFGLQSETAVIHYLSKPDADKDAVISLSLFTIGVGLLICSVLLLIPGLFFPAFQELLVPNGQAFGYFIWFILLSFLLRKSQNTFLAIQRSTLRFKSYNIYQLFSQFIPVVLYSYGFFVVAKASTAPEVISVFNYILLVQLLIAIMGAWLVFYRQPYKLTLQFKNLTSHFYSYSSKSTLDAIAKFINKRLDIYFVQVYKGIGALGQYGLAAQINNFAQESILPFTQVMNPYLVKSDDQGRLEIITRFARIVFLGTAIIAIGIIGLSPFIIPLLFGREFRPSVTATQILSLSVVISTLRIILASFFQSINRLKFNIQSNWLGVVVTIILDFILIPRFGIEGAALASVLAYLTSFLFLYTRFSSHTKTSWKDLLLIQKSDIQWLLKKVK